MKYYMSIDSGEIYTIAEIKNDYEMFKNEMLGYADFNDYFETMLSLGRERVGGFVEIRYVVHWVGGARDGEILGAFDDVGAAITFASEFEKNHESEFDDVWGGVAICDTENENNIIEW